jgi:hypothetical protein
MPPSFGAELNGHYFLQSENLLCIKNKRRNNRRTDDLCLRGENGEKNTLFIGWDNIVLAFHAISPG